MRRFTAHSRFSFIKLTFFILSNLLTGSMVVFAFLIYWGVP